MDDIVTIRASRDCYFQVFLTNGKILQFKSKTIESQAYWMAMLKAGLGRGEAQEQILFPPPFPTPLLFSFTSSPLV